MNEMESKNLINVGDTVEMEAKRCKYSNKQIHHIDIYLGLKLSQIVQMTASWKHIITRNNW